MSKTRLQAGRVKQPFLERARLKIQTHLTPVPHSNSDKPSAHTSKSSALSNLGSGIPSLETIQSTQATHHAWCPDHALPPPVISPEPHPRMFSKEDFIQVTRSLASTSLHWHSLHNRLTFKLWLTNSLPWLIDMHSQVGTMTFILRPSYSGTQCASPCRCLRFPASPQEIPFPLP